jgi:hypothetical protein
MRRRAATFARGVMSEDFLKPAAMAIAEEDYVEPIDGPYPFVSADEIKRSLRMKAALTTALDRLQ